MGIAVTKVVKARATRFAQESVMSIQAVESRMNHLSGKSFGFAVLASAIALTMTTGCSSKNYVRSQTGPLIQQTNDLDAKTAQDHRDIADTDQRAQAGIAGAQTAASTADQHAMAAGQSADAAGQSAQDAVNRVDTLSGVVANLDNYKQLSDASVTFGFDKSVLTADDKAQLDQIASGLTSTHGYILALTGGTDSVGDAEYNYKLSQKRADAVVTYLATKYNIPPHKFYLIGIGKEQPVADNSNRAGRAQNRRVEIKLMSNMTQQATTQGTPSGGQ
jgi:outer membrane protein OmpA-like peptidoglycan-associated protein